MTQHSRQALIELLFASLYLDNQLSAAEDQAFTDALEALGWESSASREAFVAGAFTTAKEAVEDEIKTEEFLIARTAEIKGNGDEADAMIWLSRVLGADGIESAEKRFLDQIQARLYPDL